MRFVTSNLLFGTSLVDGVSDTGRMAAALAELEADVLAVQEVDRNQARSGMTDQTGAIAAALGERVGAEVNWRFVPSIIGEPGGEWRPAQDHHAGGSGLPDADAQPAYGVGLITRWPVRSWHVVRLRPFPLRAPVFIPGPNTWLMIDDEPRTCVAAVVDGPCGPMTVAAVHLSFVPGWNVPQLRRVIRALKKLPAPRLLLGDLNLPAPVPAAVSRWTPLATGLPTFPGPAPRMQLDHALLHDPHDVLAAPSSAAAVSLSFSDHRALVVDVPSRAVP